MRNGIDFCAERRKIVTLNNSLLRDNFKYKYLLIFLYVARRLHVDPYTTPLNTHYEGSACSQRVTMHQYIIARTANLWNPSEPPSHAVQT
jgi:hypothetical protein